MRFTSSRLWMGASSVLMATVCVVVLLRHHENTPAPYIMGGLAVMFAALAALQPRMRQD